MALVEKRLSTSPKIHRIRIRKADFLVLAHGLCNQKQFCEPACSYGNELEAIASIQYEVREGCTVIQTGLSGSKVQGWLCCKTDGLVQAGNII